MRNHRRSGVLGGILLVTLLFAAVGQAKTKVTVGSWLSVDDWERRYGPQMDVFKQNNTDIELDVMSIANFNEYAAKIILLALTGEATDVLQIPSEQVAPLAMSGILENLEPWVSRDKSFDTRAWSPSVLKAVYYAGIMYGVPGYVVNHTYAYNTDILAQRGVAPPSAETWVTWENIRDLGRRCTADLNGDGEPDIWGYYHGATYTDIVPLIFQAGGRMFDEEDLLDIDGPPTYRAMNWLLDLMRAGIHGGSRRLFYEGKVASMRMGSYEMTDIMAIRTPIGVTSGIQNVTKGEIALVTSFAMTSNSPRKDAAWRYLKYLTSRESQDFVATQGRIPIRRDVTLPVEMKTLLTGLMNALIYAEPYPYHIHSDYILSTFNQMVPPIWQGLATPEGIVPEIQRTINAYLRQQSRR